MAGCPRRCCGASTRSFKRSSTGRSVSASSRSGPGSASTFHASVQTLDGFHAASLHRAAAHRMRRTPHARNPTTARPSRARQWICRPESLHEGVQAGNRSHPDSVSPLEDELSRGPHSAHMHECVLPPSGDRLPFTSCPIGHATVKKRHISFSVLCPICIQGDGFDLTTGTRYRVLPDPQEEARGFLRILDDSGDDYLYLADRFE